MRGKGGVREEKTEGRIQHTRERGGMVMGRVPHDASGGRRARAAFGVAPNRAGDRQGTGRAC